MLENQKLLPLVEVLGRHKAHWNHDYEKKNFYLPVSFAFLYLSYNRKKKLNISNFNITLFFAGGNLNFCSWFAYNFCLFCGSFRQFFHIFQEYRIALKTKVFIDFAKKKNKVKYNWLVKRGNMDIVLIKKIKVCNCGKSKKTRR